MKNMHFQKSYFYGPGTDHMDDKQPALLEQ